MKPSLFVILILPCLAGRAAADDLALVFQHGTAISERGRAWARRVDFATWIDDEFVVFFAEHKVSCLSTVSGRIEWVIKDVKDIHDWSVSRSAKRLAYIEDAGFVEGYRICVVDCQTGEKIFTAARARVDQIVQEKNAMPIRIALAPDDGRLLVCMFSTFYGRNVFLLDPSYTSVEKSFQIDAFPRQVKFSPNGQRVAIVANDNVLCIHDLVSDRDVFFRGTRITEKPDSIGGAVDVPFFSHCLDSGEDLFVYARDNSWATGRMFVQNLKTKKSASFDARNSHIEMDVLFKEKRIALTGTSTDLTVLDFDGNVVAHKKGVTKQRNRSVEFSPSGDRVLIGSWDNTLSVYSLTNVGK
ncbi:MAG: WD40 repeat domain-containing protein [Rubripirellula sp.]